MGLKVTKWVPYEDQKWDLINFIPDNSYKVIDTATLYDILPSYLHGYLRNNVLGDKHMVVKIVDEQSQCTITFSNIIRIDQEQGEMVVNEDQWAIFWLSGQSSPSNSGAFLQHGDYPDRTRPVDASRDFVKNVLDSGIDSYIPTNRIPINPSGSLDELKSTSHWYAADALLGWLEEDD